MLQRGCALEGCHSPDGFNDFRLRSGAQGFFAPGALRRNYEATVKEFIALDTVDVLQSPRRQEGGVLTSGGTAHGRVGPESAVRCRDRTRVPRLTIRHRPMLLHLRRMATARKRADRGRRLAMASGDVLPWPSWGGPPDPDSCSTRHVSRGGRLLVADATLGVRGAVTSVANPRSVLGLRRAGRRHGDVRGPNFPRAGSSWSLLVVPPRPAASTCG